MIEDRLDPATGPRIVIIGLGGAGGAAVQQLAEAGATGAELIAVNSDAQALARIAGCRRIRIGAEATQGLGTGGCAALGAAAARESVAALAAAVAGADLCILAAGLGGGTGTGAAPVIADALAGTGVPVIAAVTLPFGFEGAHRRRVAEDGLATLMAVAPGAIVALEPPAAGPVLPRAFAAATRALAARVADLAACAAAGRPALAERARFDPAPQPAPAPAIGRSRIAACYPAGHGPELRPARRFASAA